MQAVKSATSEYLSAQMQENPGKTAKDILGGKTFAYDDDSTDGIQKGDYKFTFDSEGKKLDTTAAEVTEGESYSTEIVDGSKVYIKSGESE